MERSKRRARPSMEGLEGRALLNGSKGHSVHARAISTPSKAGAPLDYTTDDGGKVRVQVIGGGSLAGSRVVGGVLELVYSGTTASSSIVGTVKGGSGHALLGTISDANVPITTTTGLGAEVVGTVRLPGFDLVPGGMINLLGGVNELDLNSIGPNTQLRLRDTPLVTTSTSSGTGTTGTTGATGTTSNASSGNSNVTGLGTLDPQITGFGGSAVGAINGKIASIPTVGNGQNYPGPPGLTQSQVSAGRSLSYSINNLGGEALTSVAGTFLPGPNLIEPRDISKPGGPPPPPGVVLAIRHVNGGPTATAPPLGDGQVFGYDPTARALIRFDAVTGAALQSIPLPASTSPVGGVTLARNGGRLVALVGIGSGVFAFDAVTGAPAGGFTTSSLAAQGIQAVGGLATVDGTTVVVDASHTAAAPDGVVQAIDVTQSLATGKAVAVGSSYSPAREFVLSGGIAGVPGYPNLYAAGGAHFDPFQPNLNQAGILAISPANGKLAEVSRTALTSQGTFVQANSNGTIANDPSPALGSIDSYLAVDSGVKGGENVLALITPNGLASAGTVLLADANPLAALSQSFYPELANAALIDVQGNLQSFTAQDVQGMVLNDAGNLNLVTIGQASNSAIIGLPFGHVEIASRNNVVILTSSRLVGTRGDVIVNPALRQVGPLTLP